MTAGLPVGAFAGAAVAAGCALAGAGEGDPAAGGVPAVAAFGGPAAAGGVSLAAAGTDAPAAAGVAGEAGGVPPRLVT